MNTENLWAEKDWAVTLGLVDAVAGILICLFVMFGLPYLYPVEGARFSFRIELLLLIPYLLKLRSIKTEWEKGLPGTSGILIN